MHLRSVLSLLVVTGVYVVCSAVGLAHDTWVETNTPLVRTGDVIHLDLKLGNHGNEHRDFKLHSRVDPTWVTFEVVAPGGRKYDLKDGLVETAYAPKEGYWTTTFVPGDEGLHVAVQSLDRVMQHGKSVRGIRTAKTFFTSTASLDQPKYNPALATEPLGLPIELVLQDCPLRSIAVGKPLNVRLLKGGRPLADTVVSFVPRGAVLEGEFDEAFERRTDAEGRASFTPKEGNIYLIVAHHTADDEKADEYEFTSYGTTLTVHVPLKCACCE